MNLSATYLCADLADFHRLKKEATGNIIRCYLDSSTRIIRHYRGEIRSIDGDRVVGVFVGDDSATKALRAAIGSVQLQDGPSRRSIGLCGVRLGARGGGLAVACLRFFRIPLS